jgi:hypothetical protein
LVAHRSFRGIGVDAEIVLPLPAVRSALTK